MTLNRYLNPERMKADRLSDRIGKASVFDRKLRSILEQRYGNFSERADRTERLIATHEKQLQRCYQDWSEGTAIGIELSSCQSPKVDGRRAIRIGFVPSDSTSEKSVRWLMETYTKNKGRESNINKRLMLIKLNKDEDVIKYFSDIKDDGNFIRLFDVYRAANLLMKQTAQPERISGFIERKMRAIASEAECGCKACMFMKVLESSMSAIFLFDLDRKSGLFFPRLYGKGLRTVIPEQLFNDVIIEARNVDILTHALIVASVNNCNGQQKSAKEMFDRIMKTVPGIHGDPKKNKE